MKKYIGLRIKYISSENPKKPDLKYSLFIRLLWCLTKYQSSEIDKTSRTIAKNKAFPFFLLNI